LYIVIIFPLKVTYFRNVVVEFYKFSEETSNSKH